jgi:hypothetical protein
VPYKRRDGGPRSREPVITITAIELFAKAKRLLRQPQSDERDQLLSDLGYDIAAELKLKPWMPNVFDVVGYAKPEPWEESESWWQVADLADQLEQALRERRKAKRAARRAQQSRPPTGGPPEQPQSGA